MTLGPTPLNANTPKDLLAAVQASKLAIEKAEATKPPVATSAAPADAEKPWEKAIKDFAGADGTLDEHEFVKLMDAVKAAGAPVNELTSHEGGLLEALEKSGATPEMVEIAKQEGKLAQAKSVFEKAGGLLAFGVGFDVANTEMVGKTVGDVHELATKPLELRKTIQELREQRNVLKSATEETTPDETLAKGKLALAFEKGQQGVSVLKGINAATNIYGHGSDAVADVQKGDFKKATLDGAKTVNDAINVASGAESGVKLLGLAEGGMVLKKVPVLGILASGGDAVVRTIDLAENYHEMSAKEVTSNVASVIGDVATIAAMVTPPPIDVICGGVAIAATVVSLAVEHWDKMTRPAEPCITARRHDLNARF
jgi:hypothetical protein